MSEIARFYREHRIVEGAIDQPTGKVCIKSNTALPENSESFVAMIERIPFQDRCKIIRSLERHCRRLGFSATNFLWWDIVTTQNILLFTLERSTGDSIQAILYWKRVRKGESVAPGFVTTGPAWEWDPQLQCWRYAIEANYYREALNLLVSALEGKTNVSLHSPPSRPKINSPSKKPTLVAV